MSDSVIDDSTCPETRYRLDDGTTLVNITDVPDDAWDVYIGGPTTAPDLSRSPYHNPYDGRLDEYSPYTNFKVYFFYRYLTDAAYRQRIHALSGQVLGCWCLPEACHGEVILDLLAARNQPEPESVKRYIAAELHSLDSRGLCPQGIAYRARLEEHLDMQTGFVTMTDVE